MRVAETSGRTVDEAVARALDQLGLRRDQVDVDVIREGSKGFLGLGAEEAIVRVTAKDSILTTGVGRPRRGGPPRDGRGRGGRPDGGRAGREGGREGPGRGGPGREGPGREGREGMPDMAARDEGPREGGPPGDGDDRGRRRRGRRGGRGRGRAGERRSDDGPRTATAERDRGPGRPREDREPRFAGPVIAVDPEDEVTIPGAPDDLPFAPKSDSEDMVDLAGSTLRDMLTLLGLTATEISARDPETAGDGEGLVEQVFDIFGEDDETSDELGILIGRRGETLSNFQYLLNTIIARNSTEETGPVFGVDIEGYRRRREQQLVEMALEIAAEVRETGDVITLEPMPASERRIIHLALQEEDGVRTESVGTGANRQVEVLPA